MKSQLLSLVFFACIVMNSAADTLSVSGSVSGQWNVDTVRVTDDIILEEGDSLSIYPGVLVEFQGSFSFYIGGTIRAIGTENSRIIFDVADTSGFSVDSIPDGGWNGIQFYYTHGSVDSSIFEHVLFRHGKAVSADSLENHGGAICVRYYDKVRVSNCRFEHNFALLNGGAIYLEEADIFISQNEFEANRSGMTVFPWGYGGAICSDNSGPLILGNAFSANSSTGVGGAVAIRFRDARVHSNIFTGNYSGLGGAVGYLHYYDFPHSQCNNLMYGNASAFFGGAIASIDAGPTFVNNTVTGNASTYGGAFYVKDSIVPNIYNCIFWDNVAPVGPEVYLWDAYASANFYYCDVEGGPELFGGSGGGGGYSGIYENNLDINPLFEYPSLDDFHLSLSSPCQNAGIPDTTGLGLPLTDLEGSPRIDIHAQVIDMGCYELQWVGTNTPPAREGAEDITICPNPADDRITIQSGAPIERLQIIDPSGKTVMESDPGSVKTTIHTGNLGRGIFLIKVYSAKRWMTRKVFIMGNS